MKLTSKMNNLTGVKIGSLTAIKPYCKRQPNRAVTWEWLCECGSTTYAEIAELRGQAKKTTNPKAPSCGCVKIHIAKLTHTTHGLTKKGMKQHPLYHMYHGIKQRCYNNKEPSYKQYGAKGVTMCNEWLNSFISFYNWGLANGWKKGLEIDKDILCIKQNINPRIYSPSTCMFITSQANQLATSTRSNYKYNKNIKLSPQDVIAINLAIDKGEHKKVLASRYNVSLSTIYSVIN